jgi:hypothetical protein
MAVILFLLIKYPVFSEVAGELFQIKAKNIVRVFIAISIFGFTAELINFIKHQSIKEAMGSELVEEIEGCIRDYSLDQPKQGSRIESFTVGSVFFEFENFTSEPFFYNQNFQDNFIKNGQCVRLTYLKKEEINRIVKIIQLTN